MKDYLIRPEVQKDYFETENLTREAFWNVYRPGCTEHYILHCFRDRREFIPELDLVMEKDGKIIGHIMYVHSEIKSDSGEIIPSLTFGPISVHPYFQRLGYGKALLDYSLKKAAELGGKVVCIEGNIDFYGKSGFTEAYKTGIRYNDAPKNEDVPYFLIKELKPGFLEGVTGAYHTPEGYFIDESMADSFDGMFPKKEKLRLPGQLF